MKKLLITGGVPLHGEVSISGFKNAALPVLYATVLTGDVSVIENLPRIRDVDATLRILQAIGAIVLFFDPHTVLIDTRGVTPCCSPDREVSALRASSYLLGAELARFGRARVATPGGCRIGARPLDIHCAVLRALGAEVREEAGAITAVASGLCGAEVTLPLPSVGATVNAILAATLADGVTHIVGAAREPHIVDLCRYLTACGADIRGAGEGELCITGVSRLHGAKHTLMPDMIEAGTFLTAVGAAGGEISLRGAVSEHLTALITPLRAMGVTVREEGDCLVAARQGLLFPFDLTAGPYPALPTDMHPQLAALALFATAPSRLRDTVFPDRFLYARELRRMGGELIARDGGVTVYPSRPKGGRVRAVDLRAGAALAVAALGARGRTVIRDADTLARGYEDIAGKLAALGATVEARG